MSTKILGKRSFYLEFPGSPLFGRSPSQLFTSTPIPGAEEEPRNNGPDSVALGGTCMGMKAVSSGNFLQVEALQSIS